MATESPVAWAQGRWVHHPGPRMSCVTETTCLLHFLLKQDTLHPPNQSAQHGSGRRLKAPRGPSQDGPSQMGLWPLSWVQLPPVLHGGDTTWSQRDSEDLMRTQVMVLTQRWPSPGSAGVNFPEGKRNREWNPSEDCYQRSNAAGGPGVYCTSLLPAHI